MASNRNGYSTPHHYIHSLGQSITQQRFYGTFRQGQLSFRPGAMYMKDLCVRDSQVLDIILSNIAILQNFNNSTRTTLTEPLFLLSSRI
ncbi:unnamed protein product, partial [Thlaspi arvense]